MNELRDKMEALQRRIQELASQQSAMHHQLIELMNEMQALQQQLQQQQGTPPVKSIGPPLKKIIEYKTPVEAPGRKEAAVEQPFQQKTSRPAANKQTTLEELIGKNIASKAGILVTIAGIFIGAKYAIDHELISPLLRIVLGYIAGGILVGLAIMLKKKFDAYSAVLMGGGLSVLYFITFIAFSFYGLLAQTAAFAIMLILTIGAVYAALCYNRVIIAHLAQVGAYGIPFLLSNDSGKYWILFTYIAIINAGILFLSFRKYWKSLFYLAFGVTWLIFLSWYPLKYEAAYFTISLAFLFIYFFIFYGTFLAYKLVKQEQFAIWDIVFLLTNAFIFYGLGFAILDDHPEYDRYTGSFTVLNAAIHFIAGYTIKKKGLADRALYYLILGLGIVFLTIAVPVELDGDWVTLIWCAEAALVFTIGRRQQNGGYEKLAACLTVLTMLSLMEDWYNAFDAFSSSEGILPFANITFVTGLLVLVAYGWILQYNYSNKGSVLGEKHVARIYLDYGLPAVFLLAAYFVFKQEISGYFNQLDYSAVKGNAFFRNEVAGFTDMTVYLYSVLFVTALLLINLRWIKNKLLAVAGLGAVIILLLILLQIFPLFNAVALEYRTSHGRSFHFGSLNLLARYIGLLLLAGMVWAGRLSQRRYYPQVRYRNAADIIMNAVITGCISAEYLYQTTAAGADNQYKLGLSIVWGLYALVLVIYGIWKKYKHLRLAGMALMLVTLIKLFLYDLAEAGTIVKTISFISLGVILLLV